MRVLVIVKASPESEAGGPPDERMLAEMGRFNEELVRAGVMLAAARTGITSAHDVLVLGQGLSGLLLTRLVALNGCKRLLAADLFDEKLQRAHAALTKQFPEHMDVPSERQFIGFDAFQKAMDCIRPGTGDQV